MMSTDAESRLNAQEHVSLCEALDRVLNKGAVVVGEVMISVADIDLIYLGLQLVVTSVEKGRELSELGGLGAMGLLRGARVHGSAMETGHGAS